MLQMKEFIYSILRHWKKLIIISFIVAIIGASFYFVKADIFGNGASPSNETYYSKWNNALELYIATMKYTAVGNENVTDKTVLDGYSAKLDSLHFADFLNENSVLKEETQQDIKNIVKIDRENFTNCIIIQCIYYNEQDCNKLSNSIVAYFDSIYKHMSQGYGKHHMFLIDSSITKCDEFNTPEWLAESKAYFNDAQNNANGSALGFVNSQFIITILLFVIAGDFLAVLVLLFTDIIHDRIYNINDFSKEYNVELIGDFSYYRIKGKLDKALYKLLINRNTFSKEGTARLIGYKLRNTSFEKYTLIGKAPENELVEICKQIEEANENAFEIKYVPLLDSNATSINNFSTNEKIIYTVRRFKESTKDIKDQLETYLGLGLDIIGIIFI